MATSLDDLVHDAVGEVLLRLPSQASLAVASAVCKPWLGICTSPAFLRRFRRRHPGGPAFLGLLHSSGSLSDLRVLRDAAAGSRAADLAAPLRAADGVVRGMRRLRLYQDLQILDYRGGRLLLKPRKYNHIFLHDLLTGRHAELRWPPRQVFSNMTGFLLDSGGIVFVSKNAPSRQNGHPPRCESDHACVYSAANGEWQFLRPPCRDDADAARYAACRRDVAWSQCAGEVVYSLCSRDQVGGRCLVALDTRTMSRSIVTLPSYLQVQRTKPARDFTVMELGDRGNNIGLVAADEAKLVLRVWLRREEAADDTEANGWTMYRKKALQGLVHRVAQRCAVHMYAVKVVAAYSGAVHLRFVAEAEELGEGTFCVFASLNLATMEFSNVQPGTVEEEDVFYPFTCADGVLLSFLLQMVRKTNNLVNLNVVDVSLERN